MMRPLLLAILVSSTLAPSAAASGRRNWWMVELASGTGGLASGRWPDAHVVYVDTTSASGLCYGYSGRGFFFSVHPLVGFGVRTLEITKFDSDLRSGALAESYLPVYVYLTPWMKTKQHRLYRPKARTSTREGDRTTVTTWYDPQDTVGVERVQSFFYVFAGGSLFGPESARTARGGVGIAFTVGPTGMFSDSIGRVVVAHLESGMTWSRSEIPRFNGSDQERVKGLFVSLRLTFGHIGLR